MSCPLLSNPTKKEQICKLVMEAAPVWLEMDDSLKCTKGRRLKCRASSGKRGCLVPDAPSLSSCLLVLKLRPLPIYLSISISRASGRCFNSLHFHPPPRFAQQWLGFPSAIKSLVLLGIPAERTGPWVPTFHFWLFIISSPTQWPMPHLATKRLKTWVKMTSEIPWSHHRHVLVLVHESIHAWAESQELTRILRLVPNTVTNWFGLWIHLNRHTIKLHWSWKAFLSKHARDWAVHVIILVSTRWTPWNRLSTWQLPLSLSDTNVRKYAPINHCRSLPLPPPSNTSKEASLELERNKTIIFGDSPSDDLC